MRCFLLLTLVSGFGGSGRGSARSYVNRDLMKVVTPVPLAPASDYGRA